MFKYISGYLILLFINFFSFDTTENFNVRNESSYSLNVVYKYQSTNDHIQMKKKTAPPEIAGMLEDVMKDYFIEFDFFHSEGKSLFIKKAKSYVTERKDENEEGTLSYHVETKNNVVFKNFNDNSLTAKKNMNSRVHNICDAIPQFEWKLKQETKYILGFPCQHAVMEDYFNRKISVWYTTKIPIPNGPHEFGGLPGLILEWTDGLYLCKATELKQDICDDFPSEYGCKSEKKSISLFQYYSQLKR